MNPLDDHERIFSKEEVSALVADRELEQQVEGLERFAVALSRLYKRLLIEGLPHQYAFQIVRDHHMVRLRAMLEADQ